MFLCMVAGFGSYLCADCLAGNGVIAGNVGIILADDDCIAAFVIDIGKGYLFLAFRCSVHAGSDDVNLTALEGRDEGIEANVFDFHLVAQFITDSLGEVHIKPDNFIIFYGFKRRECGFCADDESFLFLGGIFLVTALGTTAAGNQRNGCQGSSKHSYIFFVHHESLLQTELLFPHI